MPCVGSEPTIPVFENALDRAVTLIGYVSHSHAKLNIQNFAY
jgi:hypothetical protein